MNAEQWEEKLLNRGSSGEDVWDMLKDLRISEKRIEELEKSLSEQIEGDCECIKEREDYIAKLEQRIAELEQALQTACQKIVDLCNPNYGSIDYHILYIFV